MAAETTALPMNITISMGDISFILTPMTEEPSSSSDFRSPSPQRWPRRSQLQDTTPTSTLLSIRQGTSSSSPKPQYTPSSSVNQRRYSEFSSQGASGCTTGYFVELHSFTGTLQIMPSKHNMAPSKPASYSSPRKRTPGIQQNDDIITSKRTKKTISTSNSLDESAAKKSQFTLSELKNDIRNNIIYENGDAVTRKENLDPTGSLITQSLVPNQKIDIGNNIISENGAAKTIKENLDPTAAQTKPSPATDEKLLSPPLSSLTSPPRVMEATAKIARETSSALARSSKLALKQIVLAGKDAYDKLQGDIFTPPKYSAHINELSQSSFDSVDDYEPYDAFDGTDYHHACASDNLERISKLINDIEGDELFYLWQTDCNGKLPLHVLTENARLIELDPVGCEEVAISIIEKMGPANIVYTIHSNSSWDPFISVIGKWTEKLHKFTSERTTSSEDQSSSGVSKFTSATQSQTRRLSYFPLFGTTSNIRSQATMTDTDKLMYLPTNVKMTHHVTWAIRILSRLINEYPDQTREFIMTNLATVPLFLKSVLLISNFDEMRLILESSLVIHAVLDKRSINVWLISMLTSNRESRYRAVTFIKLLSRLTLFDLAGNNSSNRFSDEEIERFVLSREETFTCIQNLPGLFPAVLALGKGLESLSTSRVLRYVTASTIRKSTSFFVLLLDFFYTIFLLMGYRLHVEFALSYDSVDGPVYYREYKFLSIPMNFISGYFLLKQGITVFSLYLTSKTLVRRYCTSVSNILDFASVVMVLSFGGALLHDATLLENQEFLASLTIMLLWLRIINAYKITNSSFALFIYSVNEVINQVKWFLLFLLLVVFMFSDAIRAVVAARGDCFTDTAIDDPYVQEFCGDSFIATTVRMYSVLVGDVSLDYFQSSDAMVTVFVFFSFFSIIILFNILIAIIISAYESTKERTREIFGRARVEYAAHLIARKQFMSPTETSDFHIDTFVPMWVRKYVRVAYIMISVCALFAVEFGFSGAVYYLMLESGKDMIHSLMIIYVSIGAIFNAYIISVATTTVFFKYEKWSPITCCTLLNRPMICLEKAVKMFHQLLGFNEDMALDLTDDVNEVTCSGSE